MKISKLGLVAILVAIAGCGDANAGPIGPGGSGGGGAGGMGDPPPVDQSTFRLICDRGPLRLDIPIELVVELTEPYSNSRSTEATFSASVTLDEGSVASFIEAGITTIDITSASLTTNVVDATPTTMTATLGGTPINDIDLEEDTDDNGLPGPHRLEFDPVTATSNATMDTREVAFGLEVGGISLVLGDFSIPEDCLGLTLTGVAVRFPVRL